MLTYGSASAPSAALHGAVPPISKGEAEVEAEG